MPWSLSFDLTLMYIFLKCRTGLTCSVLSHFSRVLLFATLCIVSFQAPLSSGILQARILEWVAIPFSRGSFQLRDPIWFSCIEGRFFTIWATRENPLWLYGSRESFGTGEQVGHWGLLEVLAFSKVCWLLHILLIYNRDLGVGRVWGCVNVTLMS